MRRTMEDRWYFTKEQISSTPSVKCGFSADRELSCRQQAANFMQDMGQRLQVTQLCINTAIVYMHRFYMFHSFTQFHRAAISAAALFLAAKVEEQPRKLEHVIKVAYMCLHREQANQHLDTKSEQYLELAQDLVVNENVLLQTLGFDVAIDHPHTHVVQCCSLVKASRDLAQTSYFMASNSLHLTTMCLQYRPTLVACFCIHLAMKWSNWQIPESSEGKPWFWYVDQTVTQDALEQLTAEFLVIFEKCPSRLKRKIMAMSTNQNPALLANYGDDKKHKEASASGSGGGMQPLASTSGMLSHLSRLQHHSAVDESKQKNQDPMTLAPRTQHNYKKLIPQHHHGHGHGHRDQKSHGHVQPNAVPVPPKKSVNRPPDCMYPPPIRISDHSRQLKAEQQAQHYKMQQQHGGSHNMQQSQSSFIPNVHHAPPPPPPPPVPHSQKNKYEVPLQQSQSQQPPLPPPATPPPPPPPLPPPPPMPLSSRHQQDMALIGNAAGFGNVAIKQEMTEQNHRYDNIVNSSAPSVVIKQEPNHSIFSKPDMSSALNLEQNILNSNRFNVSDNTINTNNIITLTGSNNSSNLFNIKQEPNSPSTEQNHLHHHSHSHHFHQQQQQQHNSSSHHRNYENTSSSNNNCNGGAVNRIGRNQIKQEQDECQQNAVEQNHKKYDNAGNGNGELAKRSPKYKHSSYYPQQTNDSSRSMDAFVKKEPGQPNTLTNSAYEHTGRVTSKHLQSQQQHNVSKSLTSTSNNAPAPKSVKAPSIFSPEKDPLPPAPQVAVSQQSANMGQVNKLKRKRLSSSGSETEMMVPLIKKLQQEEIARYEDIGKSHVVPKSEKVVSSHLTTVSSSNLSSTDGGWNIGNTSNQGSEQDQARGSSLTSNAAANHTIETVEVGATIEIAGHLNDKKHKEGRERKKKKKHKEHKEHKDRDRHRHKEKHKSKDRHKESTASIKSSSTSETALSIHYIEPSSGTVVSRSNNSPATGCSNLKIRIPKEKLTPAVIPSLKVKFSKDLLQGTGKNNQDDSGSHSSSSTHQRTIVKVSASTNRHHDSSR